VRFDNRSKFWSHLFPLYVYTLAVFVACTVRVAIPQHAGPWTDKTDHFVAFAVFQILTERALGHRLLRSVKAFAVQRRVSAIALSALYGGVLEVWQGVVPWRSMELLDWVADVLGALIGAVIYGAFQRSCQPEPTA
jgi:VanZ family protein